MDTPVKLKKLILKYAYNLDPCLRKPKYSHEYYLDCMIAVLRDVTSWRALEKVMMQFGDNVKKNHYTTIRKKFMDWSDKGIFEDAYTEFIQTNEDKVDDEQLEELFID